MLSFVLLLYFYLKDFNLCDSVFSTSNWSLHSFKFPDLTLVTVLLHFNTKYILFYLELVLCQLGLIKYTQIYILKFEAHLVYKVLKLIQTYPFVYSVLPTKTHLTGTSNLKPVLRFDAINYSYISNAFCLAEHWP